MKGKWGSNSTILVVVKWVELLEPVQGPQPNPTHEKHPIGIVQALIQLLNHCQNMQGQSNTSNTDIRGTAGREEPQEEEKVKLTMNLKPSTNKQV